MWVSYLSLFSHSADMVYENKDKKNQSNKNDILLLYYNYII